MVSFLISFFVLYYFLYNVLGLKPARNVISCGLFGFSGREPVDTVKLRWLAYENEKRGKDSTGVYTIKTDKEETKTLYKDVLTPSKAILNTDFNNAIRGAKVVIGHSRAATVGTVKKENAHPFIYEKGNLFGNNNIELTETVVGAHNGFVIDIMAKKFGLNPFEVDSQLVFAMLARWGGDYKVLSQIEGALTTAYIVPEKYPDIVHLYRRRARELHFFRAKEGIYYSSEKAPLELIGGKDIIEIQDNTIVLLKDGEILDFVKVTPPKLKSIPLNASRFNYMDTLPDEEFTDYPELKPVKYNLNNHRNNNKHVNQQVQQMNIYKAQEEDEKYLKSLLLDIKNDLALFVEEKIPTFTLSDSYDDGDIESCVLIIKLLSSTHSVPLIGFVLVDSETDTINGITALNGVGVLKYSKASNGKTKTIIIADPIDGLSTWSYDVEVHSSKIQEIVLQIPIGKAKKKESLIIRTLAKRQIPRMDNWSLDLNSLYYLMDLNLWGVVEIISATLRVKYRGRKNRYIHDLRNNKVMETWDQVTVKSEMYLKLKEELNLILASSYRIYN